MDFPSVLGDVAPPEENCADPVDNPAIHQDRRSCRTKRRLRKPGVTRPKPNQNRVKVLYVNINGQTRRMWDEVCERVQQERADVLCLTETHWIEGGRARVIPGFRRYTRGRDPEDRRGGGVAIFVRQNVRSFKWRTEDESLCYYRERLWVTIVNGSEQLAIGVVYFSLDKYTAWNDHISEIISSDVSRMRDEKTTIFWWGILMPIFVIQKGGCWGAPHPQTVTDGNS